MGNLIRRVKAYLYPEFEPSSVVPHPRYGTEVVASGYKVSASKIRKSFWGYITKVIFPKSVLPADTSKQKACCFPRPYYVDILEWCRDCGKPFIFFAREQKYWFEELGFNIAADCVRCSRCRKKEQESRWRHKRFSELTKRESLTDVELQNVAEDAIYLISIGKLKDMSKIGKLKNRVHRQLPNSPYVSILKELVDQLKRFASGRTS